MTNSVQMYESVKPQQVVLSDQHHVYHTVAHQDSFLEHETSSKVMDTKSTEESKEEIAKYDTPMQMVKQEKYTVPESKRVKYVETPKTKIIQHVPSPPYEMEVVTSSGHVSNQKRCLEQSQIMEIELAFEPQPKREIITTSKKKPSTSLTDYKVTPLPLEYLTSEDCCCRSLLQQLERQKKYVNRLIETHGKEKLVYVTDVIHYIISHISDISFVWR